MLAISVLTVLTFMLTLSTYFHPSAGVFFAFVMLNGIGQAAAGSYLQTSIIAVASLFGHTALQPMMSGQAAIAVAVSGVEVISAAVSLHNPPAPGVVNASEPEEKSAFIFLSLSTLFYLVSAGAHIWLTRLPAYGNIMTRFLHAAHTSPSVGSEVTGEEKRHQLVRVAKTNALYNFAVAYVFIITLVSMSNHFSLLALTVPAVGLPAYHYLSIAYESCNPPASLQYHSLLRVQHWRLPRTLHLSIRACSGLVLQATGVSFPGSNALHTDVPDVQHPTILKFLFDTDHQL